MKTFKYLVAALAGIFLFAACAKEFSFESGFNGGNAKAALQSVNGECRPVEVHGYYLVDSAFADTNSVVLYVDVTQPGGYRVETETKNGFKFVDSGFFIRTGLNQLILKPVGRAIAKQQTSFSVAIDNSFCSFTIDVVDTIIKPMQYTFAPDTTNKGRCGNDSVYGYYKAGKRLDATNKVEIQVNVTAPGKYTIETDTINGMFFRGTGVIYVKGISKITLAGFEVPMASGTVTFPLANGASTCGFTVKVDTGLFLFPEDTAWSFNHGTRRFAGRIDSLITGPHPADSSKMLLRIRGITYPGGDSVLQLAFGIADTVIKTGTYRTDALPLGSAFRYHKKTPPFDTYFYADPTTIGQAVMTLVITKYDPVTAKVLQGTFSGDAKDATGAVVPITSGRFNVKLP